MNQLDIIKNMGLQKGRTNNPLGKPKGTKNKTTVKMKEIISSFMENKIDDVKKAFDKLEPKDKVNSFISLLKYVIPPARDPEDDEQVDAVSSLVKRLFEK